MDAERHGADPEAAPRASVVFGPGLRSAGLFLALLTPLFYVPRLYGAELLQAAWVSAWAFAAAFGAWWAEGAAAVAGPERRPIRLLLLAGAILAVAGLLALPRSTDTFAWRRAMLHLLSLSALVYAFAAEARNAASTVLLTRWVLGVATVAALVAAGGATLGPPGGFLHNGQWVGSFGNPNPAGAFAATLWPLAVGALFEAYAATPDARSGRHALLPALATLALGAFVIGTGSRAAWGAAAIGAAVTLALALRRSTADRPFHFVLPLLASCAVAACLLAWLCAAVSPGTGPSVAAPSPPSRLSVAHLGRSLEVRTRIWSGCLPLALTHPIAGIGPGQFLAQFPPYRDPVEHRTSGELTSVADAHSTVLGRVVEGGLAGLAASVLAVLGLLGVMRPRSSAPPLPGLLAGVTGSVAAAATVALFHDFLPRPAVLPAIAALAAVGMGAGKELPMLCLRASAARRYIGLALATVASGFLVWGGILPALAAKHAGDAFAARLHGDSPAARSAGLACLEFVPDWPEMHRVLSSEARIRQSAVESAERELALHPFDPTLWNDLGVLRSSIDPTRAEQDFATAARIAPSLYRAWFNLGRIRELHRDVRGALEAYTRAAEEPQGGFDAVWSAASLAVRAREEEATLNWLKRLRSVGTGFLYHFEAEHKFHLEGPRIRQFFEDTRRAEAESAGS